MAEFLLQKEDDTLEIEEIIIEELLMNNKYLHKYSTCTLKDIDETTNDKMIPVGTIDFVTKYMRKFNYVPKGKFDPTLVLSKEHMYQVSSLLHIQTEYRVYVIDNEIVAIANYEGSPLNTPDIKLIQKAISLIQYNKKWLKSYTIDIAVSRFGTALLEINNFTSIGLYHASWGSELLYAYVDGINYLKNDNNVKY